MSYGFTEVSALLKYIIENRGEKDNDEALFQDAKNETGCLSGRNVKSLMNKFGELLRKNNLPVTKAIELSDETALKLAQKYKFTLSTECIDALRIDYKLRFKYVINSWKPRVVETESSQEENEEEDNTNEDDEFNFTIREEDKKEPKRKLRLYRDDSFNSDEEYTEVPNQPSTPRDTEDITNKMDKMNMNKD